MKIEMIFTNDWELFGEGSGNFTDLQETPLREMYDVFERHEACFTLFAEIGQQWAHRDLGQPWAAEIATRWDNCVAETLRRGHDVQLHLHPTWLNARFADQQWHLDFSQWQLQTLPAEKIEHVITRGRRTLEEIAQRVTPAYRCSTFRAGAFCIQPENKTIPALVRAGITCDSSVVPGMTDHLFFDFRNARAEPGSYSASAKDVCAEARAGEESIFELPVHTQKVWDLPLLRRLMPANIFSKLQFGAGPDGDYETWSKERDSRMRRIYPAGRQPLMEQRKRALRGFGRWLGFLVRQSVIVLDYDYLSPAVFVSLVEKAARRAERAGREQVTLVSLGHSKNMPSAANIDRILIQLRERFGAELSFKTVRQSVEENHARRTS